MQENHSRLFQARWFVLAVLLFVADAAAHATIAAEAPRAVRVRLEWGGGTARLWSGLIEGGTCRLEKPVSLGVEADEPGTIWIEGKNLWLRRRSVGVYDGFDITAVGNSDSKLVVTLQSEDPGDRREIEPQRHQVEFRLGDLTSEPRIFSLTGETRLAVGRTPGDSIRVQIDRPHLVFEPGERLDASISLNLNSTKSTQAGTLTWELRRARTTTILQEGSRSISGSEDAKPTSVSIPLPESEGVYDVRFALAGRGFNGESTTVQVIVVANEPKQLAAANRKEKLVDAFDPSRVGLFRRVERRTGVRSINQSLGRLFGAMPPSIAANDEHESKIQWQAFRLQVKNPDVAHRLVVSIPAHRRQAVGISIIEPNAAGQLMPLGLDSGVANRGLNSADAAKLSDVGALITHEVTFWPKVKDPILLLHDLGTGQPVSVAKVEVLEMGAIEPEPDAVIAHDPARLVGPYLHKPYFPETFGASEALDQQTRRSLEDWETFRSGSERMVSYLRHHGFNSLLISAFADGSTLYPSALLEPTPRYDTGAYFSTGQDPIRKDVLELLYRLFDREGLALIPELQFSSPLPALERMLARGNENDRGIELIGGDGLSYRETRGAERGLAPYYNPLHPRVQEAMLDVLQEVVARYRQHAAFQGVAIELSTNGYMQFPSLDWGYDDETVARFERGTGVTVPDTSNKDRYQKRYEFLTGVERSRWVQWRCDELARFHRRLADAVTSANPNARFILSGTRLIESGENVSQMQGRSAEFLVARGIDFKRHSDSNRFVVLRPWLWNSPERPWDSVADEQVNQSESLDAALASPQGGALFFRSPSEARIAEFDVVSPWQPAFTWLAAQVSPASPDAREPYAHALATSDAQYLFDGGWTIPLGQEEQTRDLRRVIRALPAVPFHPADKQQQPAIVRLSRHAAKTWCYVVNDSRESIEVSLDWSCAPSTGCQLLPEGTAFPLETTESGSSARVSLSPYGVTAIVLDDESARIVDIRVDLPTDAVASLEERVKQFQKQIETACKSPQPDKEPSLLADPGFESVTEEDKNIPGWEAPVETAALWALDGANPRSGKSSLMLAADGGDGASLSSPVPLEGNRLVSLAVWLRSDRDDAEVKLIFEANVGREVFRQESDLRVDSAWRRYQLQVADIPPRAWESARVRVEMQGQGRIWIDDVDIQTRRLSQDDIRQLTRIYSSITLAWEEKRYSDCARMLEGHWARILEQASAVPAPTKPKEPLRRDASRLRSLFQH